MVKRRKKSQRKRAETAIAKGDEPPDPITTAALIGAAASVATPFISKAVAPKPPKTIEVPKRNLLTGGEEPMKPGQKASMINTSPQGLLETATTGRGAILGG